MNHRDTKTQRRRFRITDCGSRISIRNPRSAIRNGSLCLCASVALSLLGGCQSSFDPNLAGPSYPAEKMQVITLDIQVVRTPTTITMTNTTAREFGRSRLWLNRWFSRDIDRLAVGETIEMRVDSFHDEFGDTFRAGGFWATRRPQIADLIQLETADTMLGLIAVSKVEE